MNKDEFEFNFKQIKFGRIDNLCINLDWNEDPKVVFPIMLFTPDMNNKKEHWHIALDRTEAIVLMGFLMDYIADNPPVECDYE